MAAIFAVRALLNAKIAGLGFLVKEFRDENDAISVDDTPCVLIREGDVEILQIEGTAGGTATHRAPFFITFAAREAGGKSGRENAYDMLATTVNAMSADYSLGGQVQEVLPLRYGGEDEMANDAAAVMLEIRIDFCTSNADWNTLIF